MKTCVLLLGCLLAVTSSAQSSRREVWEWKDANGVTHYSDYPAPGARKIVLNGSPTTSVAPVAPSSSARKPLPATASESAYSSLEIWSPENDASFFEADSVVSVRIRTEPGLAPTDRLLTYLDGKVLPGEDVAEHSLSDLERGAHSLTSVIVDSKGKEKIRSQPVIFHMKQTTVTNPRNQGPSQRPKPTPKPAGKPAGSKGG